MCSNRHGRSQGLTGALMAMLNPRYIPNSWHTMTAISATRLRSTSATVIRASRATDAIVLDSGMLTMVTSSSSRWNCWCPHRPNPHERAAITVDAA